MKIVNHFGETLYYNIYSSGGSGPVNLSGTISNGASLDQDLPAGQYGVLFGSRDNAVDFSTPNTLKPTANITLMVTN